MKKIIFISGYFFIASFSAAQNCSITSVGYPPVNDLGTGYWNGAQGGLYPNGSNFIPASHLNAGLNIANNIQPLDTSGNIDAVNGWVVWVSLGMSNTTQETQVFIPMTDTFSLKNPKLKLVDCAQGGQAIVQMLDTTGPFWPTVNNRLAAAGKTRQQVQVAWFKQAEMGPSDTSFATYPDALKNKFRQAMQLCKTKFPNLKLCYLSSRIYAGYATTMLNPEPYAWYSAWSVKRLIEDQINGDTLLTFTGSSPRSAWLAWGPYLWADGLIPRSDGLTWVCPADFNPDGTHPAMPGRQKVANMLFNFFSTDSTSVPWFLNNSSVGENEVTADSRQTVLYPNPTSNELYVISYMLLEKNVIEIYDLIGKKVLSKTILPFSFRRRGLGDEVINVSALTPGVYTVLIRAENKVEILKLVKQ
jgi:hypothetical protein